MAQKIINVGTDANYGDGEPLRSAFIKVNENFTEVYADISALKAGAIVADVKGTIVGDDSTILVDGVNSSINLAGTVKGDIVPDTNVAYDIGSATKRFKDLYLSGNTINLGGTTLSVATGKLQVGGTDVGSTISFGELTNKPNTLAGYGITDSQATLVSGTNIKTVNGTSLLGSGDVVVSGYSNSDVDTHLNTGTASQNDVLSWNGADYAWVAQSGGGALEGSSIENTGTNSFSLINFKTNGGNQVAATGFGVANNEIQFTYHNSDTGNGYNAAERASLIHFVNQLANGTAFTFVYVNNSSQTVTVNATVDSVTVDETRNNNTQTLIQIFCTEDITPQLPGTTESLKNGETHTLSFSDTATLTLPVRTDNVLTANSIDTIQGKTIDGTKNTITGLTFAFDTIHEDKFFVTVSTATATTVAGSGTNLRSSRPLTPDAKVNVYQVEKNSAEEKRCTLNFDSSDANTNPIQGKIIQVWNSIGGSYDLTVDYRNYSNSAWKQAVIPSGESAVFMFASTSWVLLGID